MVFRDLLKLPFDSRTRIIDRGVLRQALPQVPDPVLQQVMADHGRNPEFQQQYGAIDLAQITWHLVQLSAADLTAASVYADFQRWVTAVSKRLSTYPTHGWQCVDPREEVVLQWERAHTWLEPPVFLQNVPGFQALHLVEGHSRFGTLKGSLEHGLIPSASLHSTWVGR